MGRLIWSCLGLTLTGLLGWLLWWWVFLPRVHVACLPIVDYDALALPPIPYSGEDAAAFTLVAPREPAAVWRDLQTSENLPTLGNRLQGIVSRPQDILILYLSAHGISENGTAYLLCSDYLRQAEAGRYPLADLLRQLERCPAALKLLILDTGHLASDPRLGLLANEFPRLLEAEVQRVNDSRLWVLAANRALEITHVSHAARRSIFGDCVTRGLQGSADANHDGLVDIAELADYVQRGVAAWTRQASSGQDPQTTWLLQGGIGTARPSSRLALLPISSRHRDQTPASPSPSVADAAERPSTDAGQTAPPVALQADTAQTPAAPTAGTDSPPTADTKPPASRRERQVVRELLEQGWQLRDRWQTRQPSEPWLPTDYAPHLWREFEQLLLGYELRYRAGSAFDAKELAAGLRANVLPLKELATGGEHLAGLGPTTVVARLAAARQQFLRSPGKAGLEQDADEVRVWKTAWQLKNDLLQRAPDWVRWHAHAARTLPRQHRLYEPLTNLLIELQRFQDLVDRATDAGTPTDAAATSPPTGLRQPDIAALTSMQKTLLQLREQIEQPGLEQEAAEALKSSAAGSAVAVIESLLSTPSVSAELRMRLIDHLAGTSDASGTAPQTDSVGAPPTASESRRTSASSPQTEPANVRPSADAAFVPQNWRERLAEQTHLESQLVALAKATGSAADRLETPTQESIPGGEPLWQQYRKLGQEFREFYQGLPTLINSQLTVTTNRDARGAERALRLLDARDAKRIQTPVTALVVPGLRLSARPAAALTVDGPREAIALPPDQPATLDLAIRATGLTAWNGQVQLDYDPELLTVSGPEGSTAIEIGKWTAVTLREGSTPLAYRVLGRVASGAKATLAVRVRSGTESAERAFEFGLSAPDVVDLVVRAAAAGTPPGQADDPDRIVLRPFPNRITSYRWELWNRSGRPKQVTVQLATVPERLTARRGLRESPLDELGNLRADCQSLHAPLPLTLPAEARGVPIPFPSVAPPGPEKPAATPEAAAKPAPDSRPLITSGLICVVRESGPQPRRWVRRIDFSPLAPKEYLDPAVSYDLSQRQIVIDIKPPPAPSDGVAPLFPPVTAENPLKLVWDTAGTLDPATRMKDRGELASASETTRLFAQVEPGAKKEISVRLTADGWPRAFQYLVKCDRDRQHIDRLRSLSQIRITAPRSGQAFRMPLEEPILFQFQADAPEDAFQEAGDRLEVSVEASTAGPLGDETKRQLFSDRQVEIRWHETSGEGDVKLATRVQDFELRLDTGGLKNMQVNLVARLQLANRPDGPAAEDRVEVILDGADPILELSVPATTIMRGQDVQVSMKVLECLSGVAAMDVGFDLDRSGALEEAEKPKTLKQPTEESLWSTVLPTKDLEPGTYQLLVRATSRVGLQATESLRIIVRKSTTEPGMAAIGSIDGRVVLQDGRPLPRFRVTIKENGQAVATDDRGQFSFRNLAPGKYTLQAKGAAIGRELSGVRELVVPAGPKPAQVEIRLEW